MSVFLNSVRRLELWHWVILGLIGGGCVGFLIGEEAENLRWIGQIFINLIMMVIAPLVFFSIVSGIISLGDPKMLGRIGFKAILGYIGTTILAITLAFTIANQINPGEGVPPELAAKLEMTSESAEEAPERPSLVDIVLGIVPTNAVKALSDRKILQVIFFAAFVGVVMVLLKNETPRLNEIVHESATIFYKIIEVVIKLAPIAVFALTAWAVGVLGTSAILSLAKLVFGVVTVCFTQYLMFGLLIFVFTGFSPLSFYRKSAEYQIIAFSTSSSSATIPTTMSVLENRLGVSKSTAAMIVPLGATVNMNGTAMYLAVSTVFVAELVGVSLSMDDYMVLITTITLISVGTAAVPGGSIVMMPIVFGSVGLPLEAIALILGVDRILDMVRTVVNVTGDAAVSFIIDSSEGNIDKKTYHS